MGYECGTGYLRSLTANLVADRKASAGFSSRIFFVGREESGNDFRKNRSIVAGLRSGSVPLRVHWQTNPDFIRKKRSVPVVSAPSGAYVPDVDRNATGQRSKVTVGRVTERVFAVALRPESPFSPDASRHGE